MTKKFYNVNQSSRALYFSGIPSLRAGTQPPSCLYLDNRLYMSPISHMKISQGLRISARVSQKILKPN